MTDDGLLLRHDCGFETTLSYGELRRRKSVGCPRCGGEPIVTLADCIRAFHEMREHLIKKVPLGEPEREQSLAWAQQALALLDPPREPWAEAEESD
jgi:hypothetical protein